MEISVRNIGHKLNEVKVSTLEANIDYGTLDVEESVDLATEFIEAASSLIEVQDSELADIAITQLNSIKQLLTIDN